MGRSRSVGVAAALLSLVLTTGSVVALLIDGARDPVAMGAGAAVTVLGVAGLALHLGAPRASTAPGTTQGGPDAVLRVHSSRAALPSLSARLSVAHDILLVGTALAPTLLNHPARLEHFLHRPDHRLRILLPEHDERVRRDAAENRGVLDHTVVAAHRDDIEVRSRARVPLPALVLDGTDLWLELTAGTGGPVYAVTEVRDGSSATVLVDELEGLWRAARRVEHSGLER